MRGSEFIARPQRLLITGASIYGAQETREKNRVGEREGRKGKKKSQPETQ